MKKILLSLFILFSISFVHNTHAQEKELPEKCDVEDIILDKPENLNENSEVTLTIKPGPIHCSSQAVSFNLSIMEWDEDQYYDINDVVYTKVHKFHTSGEDFVMKFKPGREYCKQKKCNYFIKITIQNESSINNQGATSSFHYKYHSADFENIEGIFKEADKDVNDGRISFYPISTTENKPSFEIISISEQQTLEDIKNSACHINKNNSEFGFSEYGDQRGKLIIDENGSPNIELFIPTENCSNKDHINVIIKDTSGVDEEAESANVKGYHPDEDNFVKITYQIGEEDCDAIDKGVRYCNYGMKIQINKHLAFENTNNSDHISKTKVLFNCYKLCDTGDEKEWKLLQTNLSKNSTTFSTQSTQQTVAEDSGCLNSDGNYNSNCYDFLAQIDGLGEETINEQGNKVRVIKDLKNLRIGDYVNQLYTVGVGLLAVFAVVMMITSGVQYMTEGSIFGKSLAKERMTNAGLGLILALSIYLILNTINPELLDVNFGKFDAAKISIIDGPAELDNDGYYVNKKGEPYRVNGQKLKENGQWTPEGTETWKSIVNIDSKNIFVNKPGDCSRIGQSCTSLYFSPEIYTKLKNKLLEIQKKCDCKFTITGGSEFWWHNTHSPYNATIDISINPQKGATQSDIKKLNKTLTCGYTDNFKTAQSSGRFEYKSKSACLSGVLAYAEGGKQPHWHIDFE